MVKDDERRSDRRLDTVTTGLAAKVFIGADKNASMGIMPVLDFSKGGACMYVAMKVDPPTPVKMVLEGLPFAPLEGTVAWITTAENDPDAPEGAKFRIGIDFRPKDKAAKDNLVAVYDHVSKLADQAAALDDGDDES